MRPFTTVPKAQETGDFNLRGLALLCDVIVRQGSLDRFPPIPIGTLPNFLHKDAGADLSADHNIYTGADAGCWSTNLNLFTVIYNSADSSLLPKEPSDIPRKLTYLQLFTTAQTAPYSQKNRLAFREVSSASQLGGMLTRDDRLLHTDTSSEGLLHW